MAQLFMKDQEGNTITIEVEISGVGRVINPGDPDWVDKSAEKQAQLASKEDTDGQPVPPSL